MKDHTIQLPRFGATIALVGRTNVGKSRLFNRILEAARSMVSPIPGTTRDRTYGTTTWRGQPLTFIDTGGLDADPKGDIERNVIRQAHRAIAEADLILMVADATAGVLPQEATLATELHRQSKKPVLLVANKADNPRLRSTVHAREWFRLRFGAPIPVSAANGSGVGDLLDLILNALPPAAPPLPVPEAATRIAIVGKPNVGKSSLLNALVGEERAIVSPIAGTTREPEDTLIIRDNTPFLLVDTAGIRRRASITPGLERAGVERSLRAIERAEVVFFVLDATAPFRAQDRHLGDVLLEAGRAVVVIANKWDAVPTKTTDTMRQFESLIIRVFPHLFYAPIRFVSALLGERVPGLLDDALLAKAEWSKTIPAADLDAAMRRALKKTGQGKARGRPYLYGLKQTETQPPAFATALRGAKAAPPPALVNIIERELRQQFGFVGTPISIEVKPVKRQIPRS